MKKNLVRALVPMLAIVLASFTMPKTVCYYFIYISGIQRSKSSYSSQTSNPGTRSGYVVLWWIRVCVYSGYNGLIEPTEQEFLAAFDNYDTNSNGTLDDENEIAGELEKQDE